jgi:hypothetical protein
MSDIGFVLELSLVPRCSDRVAIFHLARAECIVDTTMLTIFRPRRQGSTAPFEHLHGSFMLNGRRAGTERSQIPAAPRSWIPLARIQTVTAV